MSNKLVLKKRIDLNKSLKSVKDIRLKVGFPKEISDTLSIDDDGVTALEKANANNFGLGVPKRPFMSLSAYANKNKYSKLVNNNFKKVDNLPKYINFLNKLGLTAQTDIQQAITKLRTPANSKKTIEKKGSSNPLIDSGHMLQSVTYHIGDN